MNKERLKIASEYLKTQVDPKKFDMKYFRRGEYISSECKTVGNVIGHLTVLDDKFKTDPNYFRYENGYIKFENWVMRYYELTFLEYLFISNHEYAENFSKYTGEQQLAHAIERIDYLIYVGLPKGFKGYGYSKKFPLGFSKDSVIQMIIKKFLTFIQKTWCNIYNHLIER